MRSSMREWLSPCISRSEPLFLAFPLTNVTIVPNRRQRADHTQRSPVCDGILRELINSDFLLVLFPLILVFAWNGIFSLHLLSRDEMILTKKEGTITEKGQRTRRRMYLMHPSILFLFLGGTIACTITRWMAGIGLNCERATLWPFMNPSPVAKNRWDSGVKFSREKNQQHFWRKSGKIQEDVQVYSSNDCT